MTLREAIADATRRLTASPALQHAAKDAELLLLSLLDISRATLLAHPERPLTSSQVSQYNAAVTRRLHHEPIQYILGVQEFYGLPFRVTPAVLIPRPETEHLVEAVLSRIPPSQPARILDLGTGSGAIAIALATHLPLARLTAVDLSRTALDVASANADRHHVSDRIRFVESDLLTALPGELFDVIVSNPPYIPEADRATLHPQVRDHEPPQALFAGHDGLAVYRRLIPASHAALVPGGLLALEIGYGQREAITGLLANWTEVSFLEDLQAIPRVAIAARPEETVPPDGPTAHRAITS